MSHCQPCTVCISSAVLICSGGVLSEWGFTWEMRWGFQLQAGSAPVSRKRKVSPASSLNVNMALSLDYAASSGAVDSPLECVSTARRHLLDSTQHHNTASPQLPAPTVAPPTPVPAAQAPQQPLVPAAAAAMSCASDSAYDSFDDCLRAAEHRDAVLSYYYADEKESGAVKVVEIFPLHHHSRHYGTCVVDHPHHHSAAEADHPRPCASDSTHRQDTLLSVWLL